MVHVFYIVGIVIFTILSVIATVALVILIYLAKSSNDNDLLKSINHKNNKADQIVGQIKSYHIHDQIYQFNSQKSSSINYKISYDNKDDDNHCLTLRINSINVQCKNSFVKQYLMDIDQIYLRISLVNNKSNYILSSDLYDFKPTILLTEQFTFQVLQFELKFTEVFVEIYAKLKSTVNFELVIGSININLPNSLSEKTLIYDRYLTEEENEVDAFRLYKSFSCISLCNENDETLRLEIIANSFKELVDTPNNTIIYFVINSYRLSTGESLQQFQTKPKPCQPLIGLNESFVLLPPSNGNLNDMALELKLMKTGEDMNEIGKLEFNLENRECLRICNDTWVFLSENPNRTITRWFPIRV